MIAKNKVKCNCDRLNRRIDKLETKVAKQIKSLKDKKKKKKVKCD